MTAVPQSVEALAGSAITIPPGRLSVKSRLSTSEALTELSMKKVNVLRSPREMELGAKLLEKPGSVVSTVRSMGRLMLEPALEDNVTAGLVCAPGVLAVTSTVTVQLVEPPISAPLNAMVVPPSGAESVPLVPRSQLVDALAGSARVIGPGTIGRTSVKARSVTGDTLPLVMVKVMVLTLPGPIVLGVKTFDKVGCAWADAASNRKVAARTTTRSARRDGSRSDIGTSQDSNSRVRPKPGGAQFQQRRAVNPTAKAGGCSGGSDRWTF